MEMEIQVQKITIYRKNADDLSQCCHILFYNIS